MDNGKSIIIFVTFFRKSYQILLFHSKLLLLIQALESVEEALNKLEDLLQELHLANSNLGKENLRAACSDLERIRKLKKEAEFLEASFRAKAASLEQVFFIAFYGKMGKIW